MRSWRAGRPGGCNIRGRSRRLWRRRRRLPRHRRAPSAQHSGCARLAQPVHVCVSMGLPTPAAVGDDDVPSERCLRGRRQRDRCCSAAMHPLQSLPSNSVLPPWPPGSTNALRHEERGRVDGERGSCSRGTPQPASSSSTRGCSNSNGRPRLHASTRLPPLPYPAPPPPIRCPLSLKASGEHFAQRVSCSFAFTSASQEQAAWPGPGRPRARQPASRLPCIAPACSRAEPGYLCFS